MSVMVGLDVGDVRVGVAVSDESHTIAFPLDVVRRVGGGYGFRRLERLLGSREVGLFVLGIPLRTDGKKSVQGEKVEEYGHALRRYFGVDVVYRDERFTSQMAEAILVEGGVKYADRTSHIDKIAAQLILQDYLDYLNAPGHSAPGQP